MIKFHTLLTQPIIVVRIGSTWNFDGWKWAALSDTMRVEVFKSNDLFPSFCDFTCNGTLFGGGWVCSALYIEFSKFLA
jgi:hypothetical protein